MEGSKFFKEMRSNRDEALAAQSTEKEQRQSGRMESSLYIVIRTHRYKRQLSKAIELASADGKSTAYTSLVTTNRSYLIHLRAAAERAADYFVQQGFDIEVRDHNNSADVGKNGTVPADRWYTGISARW